MDNIYEELENIFQNFRWIDDIPEDQNKRDENCLEARAALLIKANCTSERFPAFIRNAQKSNGEKWVLRRFVTELHRKNRKIEIRN